MKQSAYLVVAALFAAGCSAGPSFTAGVISTLNTVGTGQQRILIELRDAEGEALEADEAPNATLRNENGSPLGVYPGELVWLVPDELPVYSFVMDIPEPETYQVTVDVGELGETPPAGFVAVADPTQVVAGQTAPAIEDESIPGPVLLVFASPDWCPARSCRPMIEQVEEAAGMNADVSWSRVDVFVNPEVDTEEELELAPVVEDWGLPSQPWLYVIDRDGVVSSLFEGGISDAELAEAIQDIAN